MTRPQPKFHPRNRLGIAGGIPAPRGGRPSSQDVMAMYKKNNPTASADLLQGMTAFNSALGTPFAAILATDPVLRGIGGMFDIDEIKNIQDAALDNPYGMIHEVNTALSFTGFSPSWKQAELDARQEQTAGTPIKPKGAAFSKGLAGFKSPSFTRVMNQASEGPRTGLQSWAVW